MPAPRLKKMTEDQLGVKVLGPTYFGAAAGRAEAGQGNQDARRHGRHQAAHAGRRRLAVPGPGARRKSDADGLCRGLYWPADRCDRRSGQPAAKRREHEVLRGDVADRPDLASRRLRPAHYFEEGVGRDGRRETGKGSRQLPTRPSTSPPKSTSLARRNSWRRSRARA